MLDYQKIERLRLLDLKITDCLTQIEQIHVGIQKEENQLKPEIEKIAQNQQKSFLLEKSWLKDLSRLDTVEWQLIEEEVQAKNAREDQVFREHQEKIALMEKEQRELLRRIEETENRIEQLKKQADELESLKKEKNNFYEKYKQEADSKIATIQTELSDLESQKRTLLEEIERHYPQFISTYEKTSAMVKLSEGIIVPIQNHVCSGCQMSLGTQKVNATLRGESIQNCPYCHRILIPSEVGL